MSSTVQRSALTALSQKPTAERAAVSSRFHFDYDTWHARIAGFASKSAPARVVSERGDPGLQDIRSADTDRSEPRAA